MRSYHRFLYCFAALVLMICFGSNATYSQWAYPRQWNVYPGPDPETTRMFIQSVIDRARDGDVIYFNRGTYDFSAAPAQYSFQNGGALQIIDKSLVIKGAFGSIIKGSPVVIEPDTGYMIGINCFWILNSDANKDVTFDGLTFKTFMMGILALHSNNDPVNPIYYSNLRNLVVKNCKFLDIKRNGVACAGMQGNITISNNKIYGDRASSRMGIYLDWLYQPGMLEWQPGHTLVTITDNSIAGFNYSGILSNRSSRMQITCNAVSDSGSGIIFNVGLKNEAKVSNNTLTDLDSGVRIHAATDLYNGVTVQNIARRIRLTYNTLSNLRYAGIFVWGDVAHSNYVAYNKINMTNPEWGPAIYSTGHDEQYMNNIISGYGTPAVYLGGGDNSADGGPIWGAHHEFFLNNSVSGFTPNWAPWHYELDGFTHDNVVIGMRTENATYMDYGINNIFKFVYPYVSLTMTTSLISPVSARVQQKSNKEAATI